MIINHNMQSINAHRQMGINATNQSKATEKLSSGLRINRAGDDAAGLAISEKMRGQIRGLDQAGRNAQDGISLIQTAEGALNETHSILQRMRELSVQASTDTNTDADRTNIQDEMDQLVTEIDRISNTTEFNTQKLLDGSFKGTFQIGANEGQKIDLSISGLNAANLGLTSSVKLETKDGVDVKDFLADGKYTVNEAGDALLDASGKEVGKVAGKEITLADGTTKITFAKEDITAGSVIEIGKGGTEASISKTVAAGEENKLLGAGEYKVNGTDVLKDGMKIGVVDGTTKTQINLVDKDGKETGEKIDLATVFGKTGDLATGNSFTINGADVSNKSMAAGTITAVDKALQQVSKQRSQLGAVQNRLEHTINNLGTSSENLTAAESRIRDVDMAKEMMNFTKTNVLNQAAQAMLAQANQLPNQVLSLLR